MLTLELIIGNSRYGSTSTHMSVEAIAGRAIFGVPRSVAVLVAAVLEPYCQYWPYWRGCRQYWGVLGQTSHIRACLCVPDWCRTGHCLYKHIQRILKEMWIDLFVNFFINICKKFQKWRKGFKKKKALLGFSEIVLNFIWYGMDMDMGNNGNAPQIRFAFAQKCETQERLKWWRSLCLHTLTEYISIDF